ncbi:hypothetical protein FHL15_006127 [Xylaria flabelliformis]|uniref:Rhodopsin domain-containing protein n=1 Tax=Xylaria flabelliformis TaxID=2512241 RepID=A0A553HYG1_9PEZI|nr:hypothetical protein FHL15_006127 [Xylaria flabelliformis]
MGLPIEGTQVVIVSFISTPLAMIALGLRLWSRRLQGVSFAFNDYMAIIAMVLATATVSVCLAGKIIPEFRSLARLLIDMALDVFIGAIGVHADKLQATSPWVLVLYTTFNWDKTIPNGKCHNQNLAYLLAGITNIVIDAFIVALPLPKLYGLQIPLAKRIAIGAMFGLGALICVLSLLRILSILSWNLADSTYTGTGIAVYSILEPTLGVVNACLPTTRPALKVLFKNGPFSWSQKSIHGSHISKNQDSHQFERLKDDVALNNIQVVSSPQSIRPQGNNITILREWDVSLSHPGDGRNY